MTNQLLHCRLLYILSECDRYGWYFLAALAQKQLDELLKLLGDNDGIAILD